ncbi:MAG: dipeptidase [Bacteroidia bacterium]|jgi:acetylornithine deacetylase/succinyl-diaminopimelate desuccinylase-like protein|nr:dipeptidase [Paludibacter sp.]MDD3490529.1 dipeptidase [Paludibacter sp.]NCB68115.1 dipeptidase [Bacteroidia bacterium]
MEIKKYISTHSDRFLNELFSLIRIPSVSAHSHRQPEIAQCAMRWKELLLEAGADSVEILPTKGNPVVFGKKMIDAALPTILIYGHYDVMPAEPLDLWHSPAFEPEVRDGHIFARGADDDKGQSFMHAKAFEYMVSSGELNCNVKFLLEGEEEIGSPSLEEFCEANKELLACDTILVSDTSMLAADKPSITTGLRGLAYWQIEVTAASRDLHSGIFGGAVANPVLELTKILSSLSNSDGKVTIPGFYDNVEEVSAEERALIAKIPFDEAEYKANLNIRETFGEKGYSTIERTGIRPALDICGIWGGYTGEGSKTVLPSKAFAKLSARLVPNQRYAEIAALVEKHILSIAPSYVDVKVEQLHGAESYVCPIDSDAYRAAERAYTKVFGIRPLPVRRGGSIGVIPVFEKVLEVKPILMGFGLESDAIHSPNENFPLELFYKGIETIVEFYREFK